MTQSQISLRALLVQPAVTLALMLGIAQFSLAESDVAPAHTGLNAAQDVRTEVRADDSRIGDEVNGCKKIPEPQTVQALARAELWAKKLTTFKARFLQESSAAALGASEQSGGDLVYQNPGRMRWRYEWPENQEFVITEDTMQLYQPALKQLMIDSARAMLRSELPVAFLTGLATVTEKFSVERGCRDNSVLSAVGKNSQFVRIELRPKQKAAIVALHLVVNQVSGQVVGATIIDESENITTFAFQNIVEGAALSADQFTLKIPPGTDVQDNRKK